MKLPITDIRPNPTNPRTIKDEAFNKLVKSLKEFPEMLDVREIVVNTEYIILGGNMRFKAAQAAGFKEIPVKVVDWTEEKQNEFIIKDNVSGGEWDYDQLANQWEREQLEAWGLDLPALIDPDFYTADINTPTYEPRNEKPDITELYDTTVFDRLMAEIESSGLPDDDKTMLRLAAHRHIVFDYAKIADYYANSEAEVQNLMENSALIIIDYQKAIELGYVKLTQDMMELQDEEYSD